ncbi:MAG TPA: aminotransferase class III-fold pyridoxal phosphate-dependent enzyme [Pyrinomonadaceae bacterium]
MKTDLVKERQRLLGRNLSIAYEKPLNIVHGSMQYLFDADGRRYLDAYNNVAHVGHCHPKVVAAGQRQMELLNTNTRYLSELILEYAKRLTATLPESLSVCYFVNSGSEANELAVRLARAHTKAREMIVLDHAYHGNTSTLIDLSPYKHNGPGGEGAPPWVHAVALPASELNATAVGNLIAKLGSSFCGFIAESFPSVAGQIVLPEGYLGRVYEAVRGAGGVCIADEVQTGYGRIGTHFYGFEKYEVVPDIVVLGKPIGNGHPIGAVITTRAIADSFDNGMEFFSTFGGNNVSCAIGLAVLEVVQEENLQRHALSVGERLLGGLRAMQQRYSLICDVRGSGLHLGVEFVRDDKPAAQEANAIVNRMREHGILIGTDGPYHNVLKIRPPMPFSSTDADQLLTTLDESLKNPRNVL